MRFLRISILCLSICSVVITKKLSHENVHEKRSVLGWTNLSTLLENIKDIFSIVTNGNYNKDSSIPIPEDAHFKIEQLALKYGYNFEEYNVTTDDGYVLKLHRIYLNKNDGEGVFLMHGLIDSSDSWILQGNNSLGYILADQGYDVWLGNARGNKHSTRHVKLTNKDPDFWRFTWEEIGLYDLPAMIDYATNFTKKKSFHYIGHSQGTTSLYVMLSMRPDYNEKIKMTFALSPVAYMSHVKSPVVRLFSPTNTVLAYWLSNFNAYSPSAEFLNRLLSVICYLLPRCDNLWSYIVGDVSTHISEALLPVVFGHLPSGSSTLQFVHYGQLVQSGRFCRYDYGVEENLKIYGAENPSDYNLNNVIVPTVLFYGGHDWLSDPEDVKKLQYNLPNVNKTYYIEDYNHLDFMYASTAKDLIYSEIVRFISYFE